MLIELMEDESVAVKDTAAWTIGRVCELVKSFIRLGQKWLDLVKVDQIRLDQARQGQARLDKARLSQARLGQARLDQARLDQARLDQARLGQARLIKAMLMLIELTKDMSVAIEDTAAWTIGRVSELVKFLGQARLDQVRIGLVRLSQFIFCLNVKVDSLSPFQAFFTISIICFFIVLFRRTYGTQVKNKFIYEWDSNYF